MRQSQLFGKTLKESPKDEVSANAKLLERGGFVHKTMAGAYDYLPLGFRVMQKITSIIREEMNAVGGQEVLLTALQPKERWDKTGRWEELGKEVMYQFKDHSGRELGLAATHEEALAEIAVRSISSYHDLPLFLYQIQSKFRDELRAKSGLLRGREFLMKDLYSFHATEADLQRFYAGPVDRAYKKIFKRCGLDTYLTEASGGTFTKEFTHEYQVFSEAGEDLVFYCKSCRYAQNREVASLEEGGKCRRCDGEVGVAKSIEVGNIFKLGTKYSKGMGLFFTDKTGSKNLVVMGSYGIGGTRVMGAVVETHNDERGIVWPEEVAPYQVHLLELKSNNVAWASKVGNAARELYQDLVAKGVEVLYDDRGDKTPGEKFADADLLGIPWRVVVSDKTLKKRGVEVKRRGDKDPRVVPSAAFIKKVLLALK